MLPHLPERLFQHILTPNFSELWHFLHRCQQEHNAEQQRGNLMQGNLERKLSRQFFFCANQLSTLFVKFSRLSSICFENCILNHFEFKTTTVI